MKYYRIDSYVREGGIELHCQEYISIHETPCFHFCISGYDIARFNHYKTVSPKESSLALAKRIHLRIRRISKDGSRIAKPTKEQAFENYKLRKRLQIKRCQEKLNEINVTLEALGESDLQSINTSNRETYENQGLESLTLNGTKDFVRENYCFY